MNQATKQIVCKKTALPLSKRLDKIIKPRLRSPIGGSPFKKNSRKQELAFCDKKKINCLYFVPFWEVNASLKHVVDS